MFAAPYIAVFSAAVSTLACCAYADPWQKDVWHPICPGSPFYGLLDPHLPSAGIVQSAGPFAMIVLGSKTQGALASVTLQGSDPVERLTSTLHLARGGAMQRMVTGAQMTTDLARDGASVTYTFRVAPADIELFQAADSWTVQADGREAKITLKGSRKAIDAARMQPC